MINNSTIYKQNEQPLTSYHSTEKILWHMELEIQVLSWNRYKNVLELNNFFSSPCQRQCELLPSLGVCRLLNSEKIMINKYSGVCDYFISGFVLMFYFHP
jgi:hypothetical protein